MKQKTSAFDNHDTPTAYKLVKEIINTKIQLLKVLQIMKIQNVSRINHK